MTFNIPKKLTLISTTVDYEVAEYNENTFYEKEEVRKVDDIYEANSKYNNKIQTYENYKYYEQGEYVEFNGALYRKNVDYVKQYTISGNALPRTYEFDEFFTWDTIETTVNQTYTNADGSYDYTYTIEKLEYLDTKLYKYIRVTKTDNSTSSTAWETDMKVYYSKREVEVGSYVMLGSMLCRYNGLDSGDLETYYLFDKTQETYSAEFTTTLTYIRKSVKQAPFDTKQYTTATRVMGTQTWLIKCEETFDCIALGNIDAKSVKVKFMTEEEYTQQSQVLEIQKDINSLINENIGSQSTTEIIYAQRTIKTSGYVEVTLYENEILNANTGQLEGVGSEIGMMFPAMSMEIGATDMIFSHTVKNFDRNVVSEISGYVDHIKGNRVVQYKGTFHLSLGEYDEKLRLNKKITEELIAIDGSDNVKNEQADGENVFDSTKIIGRLKQLGMATKVSDNNLDKVIPISFEFEEVV